MDGLNAEHERIMDARGVSAEDRPTVRALALRREASPAELAVGRAIADSRWPMRKLEADPGPLLMRLREGDTVRQIAADLGVQVQRVYEFLLVYCPQEWRDISAARNMARLEDAGDRLAAEDVMGRDEVMQRSNSAKIAGWNLERVLPKLYGQPEKAGGGGVTVQVVVNRDAAIEVRSEGGDGQVFEG